jgi:hypothetical protein
MATVNLGSIKFNWQGAYAGGTAYAVDDVVSYNGSSYVCTAASTGNLPTDTNFWDQMSSAGTNGTDGTDLTTTLTTQGDLVYRDGSGLQRLGAGTSGQVLQTNGTGANPSWGTVSSDYVKLLETNVTSVVARVDFTNVFTSTYDTYKIFGSGITVDSGAPGMCFRYMNNTSYVSSSDYFTILDTAYGDSGSVNPSHGRYWGTDKFRIFDFGMSANPDHSSSFELTLMNPVSTQQATSHAIFLATQQSYSYIQAGNSGHIINSTSSFDGISIFPSSNNLDKGSFKIYGIK